MPPILYSELREATSKEARAEHARKVLLKTKLFAKLILGCLIFANSVLAQTGNDSFSGRVIVHDGEVFSAGTSGATFEPSDPTQSFARSFTKAGSKWWSWTAPTTGFAGLARQPVQTEFTWPYPIFAVYSGNDLASLTLVNWYEEVEEYVKHSPFVAFNTTVGETFSLAMVGESTNSISATYMISVSDSPIILEQPASQSLNVGDTALFFVVSPSLPAGHVQWQFGSVDIPNATNSALTLYNVTLDQSGIYAAIIEATNSDGVPKRTVSAPATLTVSGEILQPDVMIRNNVSATNEFFVKVLGQDEHWYHIESTQDFVTWQVEPIDYAYENVDSGREVQLPLSTFAPTKFLRARHLGNFQQACRANLRKLEFAKELARSANHHGVGDSADSNELRKYIGDIPSCPQDGIYIFGNYGTPPSCPWAAYGHTLP